MSYVQKIKMALAYINKNQSWLAEQLDYSPQALNQRMKTGKWTYEELERIGEILGAKLVFGFEFPDGTTV